MWPTRDGRWLVVVRRGIRSGGLIGLVVALVTFIAFASLISFTAFLSRGLVVVLVGFAALIALIAFASLISFTAFFS